MKDVSRFLRSLEADPVDQRVTRASIHLRSLLFGRLSDDHVLALALLSELGRVYGRAYRTEQVIYNASHVTQEDALEAHLRAQDLPCFLPELRTDEIETLLTTWEPQRGSLPRPFGELMGRFLVHARAHLSPPPSSNPTDARVR